MAATGGVLVCLALLAGCLTATSSRDSASRDGASRDGAGQQGAGQPGPNPAVSLSTAPTTTEPPLPVAPVQWAACGALQCGSVTVPLDYAHPQGSTIQIALARHPAADPGERIGSIVIDPGGPGSSGIDDLPNELSIMGPTLLDRFDIVSFDPRGVGRSAPVSCTPPSSGSTTASVSTSTSPSASSSSSGSGSGRGAGGEVNPTPTTLTQQQALAAYYRGVAGNCEATSGNELPYVGTVDVARDLDRIRAALGDAELTYIGHSYGTLIGATYAAMYPTHVRAMVLDGAIDPALSMDQMVTQQARGFEQSLQDFFTWCAASGCPWRPAGDPTTALLGLIARVEQSPIAARGGQTAGPDEVYDGLLAGLGAQSNWPELGQALGDAQQGDGSLLADMAGRYATGGSRNGAVAELAVDCLDHPVDRNPADYPALASQAAAVAPVFSPLLTWGLLVCAEWPALPTRVPGPANDPGAPPIMVVGAAGDPVTSYQWAVSLAQQLSGGYLLTWRGESHVASFYSACVRSYEQSYLVGGALPPVGTECTD